MAVETGETLVPQVGKLKVLSKPDAARMLRWSLLYARSAGPAEAFQIRQLVRTMKGFLLPEDLLMLADIAKEGSELLANELMDEFKKRSE